MLWGHNDKESVMTRTVSTLTALGAAAIVASCSTAPVQEARSPKAQRELAAALAGRTAQAPVRCIPNYRANQMEIIDDYTILFRDGRTVYVQNPRGGCRGIDLGGYTLVTRQYGTAQLCDGDINQIVDLRSGIGGGACVFSPFVPYKKS
jgi:hypothetical protein